MKKLLLVLTTIVVQSFCIGQNERKYDVLLSGGTIVPEANFEMAKSQQVLASELFNGVYYRYIQFINLPTNAQKAQMESLGVKLMMYLPQNTFMAAIKQGTDLNVLAPFSVHSIISIKPEYKLLKELQVAIAENNFPGYAVKGNKIGIGFTCYENISHSDMKAYLSANGYEITFEDKYTHWFVVYVNKNKIMNFVAQPFVCSAELMDDIPQPEDNVGRSSHRSNAISTEYSGGRKYNGTGVKVMLQDDGYIGPHIDYQGRIGGQYIPTNSGDHGDHCGGIIMGAGNKDPLARGMAWGSDIYVYEASPSYQGFDSINNDYSKYGIRIISTSYSDGCNAGYTTRAQQLDIQNLNKPELIHVFSAGNSGASNCSYGAGAGWGNVTGGHKHSKNSIAVANLDYLDNINSSSSRGPAHDGRLKPEVSAVGTNVNSTQSNNNYVLMTGTSMSCPGVAGVFAQLYHAYKTMNSNNNPPSALIKAIVMNTADDLGNAGPDFTHGYGRVNGLNAVQTLEQTRYLSGTISNSGLNTHNIVVPAGVRKMKVMTYWHDYQAAVSAGVALVNNINTQITTPSASTVNPLILDYTPIAANLASVAVQGIDIRNNHEQITINYPAAGNHVLNISGASIPMGPQTYYVTWIFEMDGYTLTYPIGKEGFVPGEIETIRWNTLETIGNQTLEYSTNNGSTWTNISTAISGTTRSYNWNVPSALSGQCLVRISRGAYSAESDTSFSIIPLPTAINVTWACPDSVRLTWNPAAGATSYDVFRLGTMYMDSVGTSSGTSLVIPSTSTVTNWYSVRARGPLGAVGRRAIAVQKLPGTFACPLTNDAAVNNLLSPSGTIPNCQNLSSAPVKINLYNAGINAISGVPVYYRINSGPVISEVYAGTITTLNTFAYTFTTTANISTVGSYVIKAWAKYPSDVNITNDTSVTTVNIISGTSAGLPLTENFETFTACSSAATCSLVCNLGNGFVNESNINSDQHDWRVFQGSTPSANTGPDFDYVPGTTAGKYAYLEASVPCTSLTASMLSPCVNLSTISNPMLSFAYHMYGTDMGTLYVDVFANGAWTNNVWFMSGNKGNTWLTANISLATWASDVVNIRWRGVTGGNFLSDMALDGIGIQSSTGIKNLTQVEGAMVYPNPGNGEFNLDITGLSNTEVSYSIIDVSGREVLQNNAGAKTGTFYSTINISGYAAGVYTLILKRDGKVDYIKLCKY